MDYVMVPVPEEHREDVERFLTWGVTMRKVPECDPEAGRRVVGSLDSGARAVLTIVTGAERVGNALSVEDIAHRAGLTSREIAGTIVEINDRFADAEATPFALTLKPRSDAEREHRSWAAQRTVELAPGVGDVVRDADENTSA